MVTVPEVTGSNLCWIHINSLAWLLCKCAALWKAVCGASGTESSGFLSRRDMALAVASLNDRLVGFLEFDLGMY